MVHEITLDTTVLEAIKHPEYGKFMINGSIPGTAIHTAKKLASRVFQAQDTIRTMWNEVVLWNPHFCGKKHEQPNSNKTPLNCLKRNNPCCGHPFFSKIYQTYGLAGWLAKEKDPTLVHPGQILRHLIDMDFEAIHRYGTGPDDEFNPVSIEIVPIIEREIKSLERNNYSNVTQPWIRRVAEILRVG